MENITSRTLEEERKRRSRAYRLCQNAEQREDDNASEDEEENGVINQAELEDGCKAENASKSKLEEDDVFKVVSEDGSETENAIEDGVGDDEVYQAEAADCGVAENARKKDERRMKFTRRNQKTVLFLLGFTSHPGSRSNALSTAPQPRLSEDSGEAEKAMNVDEVYRMKYMMISQMQTNKMGIGLTTIKGLGFPFFRIYV